MKYLNDIQRHYAYKKKRDAFKIEVNNILNIAKDEEELTVKITYGTSTFSLYSKEHDIYYNIITISRLNIKKTISYPNPERYGMELIPFDAIIEQITKRLLDLTDFTIEVTNTISSKKEISLPRNNTQFPIPYKYQERLKGEPETYIIKAILRLS